METNAWSFVSNLHQPFVEVKLSLAILSALLVIGCSKTEYFGPVYLDETDSTIVNSPNQLLVGCEGNFQYGNASLSLIDLKSEEVTKNVFKSINGEPVGDILQSIHGHGDLIFLVVNNSGIVRVIDRKTLEQVGIIDGLTSPRYLVVQNGKIIISDLYQNALSVYDSASLKKIREVPVSSWTERILKIDGGLAVSAIDQRSLLRLDDQLNLAQTTFLGLQPMFLHKVKDGLLVCGNRSDSEQKGVLKLLDTDFSCIDSNVLSTALVASVVINDQLLVLTKTEVIKLNLSSLEFSGSFKHKLATPYGMVADTALSILYMADAKDYLSNGSVVSMSAENGNGLKEYEVGVIPQAMFLTFSSQ